MNILITGTSSGFGYVTALYLARKGHKIYATMRDLKKSKFKHKNIKVMKLDVLDKKSIKKAVSKIKRLDVLINNAGYVEAGFFEDLSEKEIRNQMETNFFGIINVTKECIGLLKKSSGKVINLSSISGLAGFPALSAYCASKYAIEGLSESLRLELATQGISVFLIEPAAYDTEIFKKNLRIAKHSLDKKSPYYKLSKRIRSVAGKNARKNILEIALIIEKIILEKRKRFRHRAGPSGFLMLKKVLPFSIYEWLIITWLKKGGN